MIMIMMIIIIIIIIIIINNNNNNNDNNNNNNNCYEAAIYSCAVASLGVLDFGFSVCFQQFFNPNDDHCGQRLSGF